jgi:hypothetical protein
MKKRIWKKISKKEALKFIKQFHSNIHFGFLEYEELESAAGYLGLNRTVYFNLKDLKSFSHMLSMKTKFPVKTIIQIITAHECGHSRENYDEVSSLYHELFDDYDNLSDLEASKRQLKWAELVLESEFIAWDIAKTYLQHLDQEKLQWIIDHCINAYKEQIQEIKDDINYFQEENIA